MRSHSRRWPSGRAAPTRCVFRATGGPCVPPGGLVRLDNCPEGHFTCDCATERCITIWCTVGDDFKGEPGMACLAWYGPNEAPPGLEQLGVCAKLNDGPCVGKIGGCAWRREYCDAASDDGDGVYPVRPTAH